MNKKEPRICANLKGPELARIQKGTSDLYKPMPRLFSQVKLWNYSRKFVSQSVKIHGYILWVSAAESPGIRG
jgi:hypothetical protein